MTVIISKHNFLRLLTCFCLFLGLLSCSRTSSIDPIQKDTFIKYFGGGRDQKAGKVLQTADGGYLVVGSSNSYSNNGNYDQFLVKADANGNQVWSRTFGNMGDDFARDVKINPDGTGYVMVGDQMIPSTAIGSNLWSSSFNIRKIGLLGDSIASYYFGDFLLTSTSVPNGWNTGYNLSLASDAIYFSGRTNNTQDLDVSVNPTDVYIGSCDYNGNFKGRAVYGYSGDDIPTGLIYSSSNYYMSFLSYPKDYPNIDGIVTGSSGTDKLSNFPIPISTPVSGVQNNFSTAILSSEIQSCNDIKFLVNNTAIVTTGMRNNALYILIRSLNGNSIISNWFNIDLKLPSAKTEGKAISLTSDGGYIVTGYIDNSSITSNKHDVFLAKFNSSGVLEWSKSFGGTGDDEGVDVIQTTDGGYLVSANIAFGSNNNVIGLIKVKSDGSIR